MEWFDSVSKVAQASAPVLLVISVWAFAVGRVVPRWIYDECSRREAVWQALYAREKETSERLIEDRERRGQAV